HAINSLSEAKLFIDDTASANILEIKTKARRLQSEHGLSMIVLDYLQLMESPAKSDGRVQEIAEITRGLKAIARELNVPVVALSQLSRAVELNKPAIPKLAHLRESGCLSGDTIVVNAETGERYLLRDLARRKKQTPIPVYSLDESWKLVVQPMTKVFSSGKKQIYEMTLRNGNKIRASGNHPFRTLRAWTPLEELAVGDHVALPRHHTIPSQSSALSRNELIFLAHMLGDGCMVEKQPIHYTSADRENIETVARTARELFSICPKIVRQKNWWHVYLPSPYPLARNVHHPFRVWLRAHNSDFAHSYDKIIPHDVFRSSPEDISLFLNHLWATDGNISWKKLKGRLPAAAIYYSSTSNVLIHQVQHLLLRLSILSTIRSSTKDGYRACYQVHIQGKDQQYRFLTMVGCSGERGKIIVDLLKALRAINANPNTDAIPADAWRSIVTNEKIRTGLSWRDISKGITTQYCGSTLLKTGISRDRMLRLAKICGESTPLHQLATSDVTWDKVVNIRRLGVEEVYDATVKTTHNFLANDIIVHNSIEQDADVVMFIYRKAADRNYRIEELSDEEKSIAEIHIAKHRNGPTGTVRLFWDERRASFRNLDRKRDFSFFDESPQQEPPPPSVPF
ncbi:MAG: DnaB-like helicase C-terminal domain-containing protein, partial [Candidatus Uhrbacteria bacterium]|nr:DnaB-like helicase C-terminal domain-containing protein [Candidatus Uhrbacteria bacterium]